MEGGLVVSQLLTLYITPVVYIYLETARTKIGGLKWRRKKAPQVAPGEEAFIVRRPTGD